MGRDGGRGKQIGNEGWFDLLGKQDTRGSRSVKVQGR